MNAAAGRLTQAVIAAQLVVTLVAPTAVVLVAPRFLIIDAESWQHEWIRGLRVEFIATLVSVVWTWLRLRRLRFTLRALGLGSRSVEPDELEALDRAPAQITISALLATVIGAIFTLLPGVGPKNLDLDTRASLALLTITFLATASLPLYVIIRERVARAIQLAPEDSVRELIERVSRTREPALRIVGRARLAVLAPVGLVGFAVALLAHAHVLAFEARGRLATATALAQGSLEPVPGPVPDAGELDAANAAAEHGFSVRLFPSSSPFDIEKRSNGRVVVTVPLDVGHATLSFVGTTMLALSAGGVLVALLAAALAATLGAAVGRSVAEDLGQAAKQVQLLGTEAVLRGLPRIARPARYADVVQLGHAIERLAERFRIFASAQEQAIEACEAARRMRGLLFASVSHDLKSPLNSILGFADLVDTSRLLTAQRESLELIKRRGHELLTLIQTILDAARVEAGQLVMEPSRTTIDQLLQEAHQAARRMVDSETAEVSFVIEPDLPPIDVDRERIVEAFSALIRHALRTTVRGVVRVGASRVGSGRDLVVCIEAPTHVIPAESLGRLLLPDGESTMPRRLGGLALGLSLAHSLLVLHGGNVESLDTPDGIMFRVYLPSARGPLSHHDWGAWPALRS